MTANIILLELCHDVSIPQIIKLRKHFEESFVMFQNPDYEIIHWLRVLVGSQVTSSKSQVLPSVQDKSQFLSSKVQVNSQVLLGMFQFQIRSQVL